MADLATPDRLEERLGGADFVILTTPETPETVGMFNMRHLSLARREADISIHHVRPKQRETTGRDDYELPITRTGEGDDLWRWPDIVARRRAVRALPDIAALIADGEVRWKP